MEKAAGAYKTAGMSANEYMETVTGFSAALIKSLDGDTVAAAEKADLAITDMSDNANKMGSSMESIQNAYQGFAKQNYTMLDNLKLGYGGTKEEMQRLLEDATALSGVEYDLGSYADVVDAIHVIQTEMGITGTTAKEASSTISGSVSMTKSAWSNLVVGVADDSQDFDALIDNFVDSVETVAENILPRVETTLLGVGKLVESLLPVIIDRVPDLINDILPELLQSGMNLITTLMEGMQQNLPEIVQGVFAIISQFVTTFIEMLPLIIEMGIQVIVQLVLGIAQALPELIPQIVDVILTIVDTLINNIDLLVDAAIQLIIGLAVGLINALPMLIERVPEIIIKLADAIVNNAGKLAEAALQLIITLGKGLIENIPTLIKNIPQIIEGLVAAFNVGMDAIYEIGKNIVDGIWNGLKDNWDSVVGWIKNAAGNIIDAAKETFGINSPSKEFGYIAKMCIAGFEEPMEEFMDPSGIVRNINSGLDALTVGAWKTTGMRNEQFKLVSNVYLEGDAKGVFKLVRQENDIFKESTGESALV